MPVPASINDLSTTAGSNSPPGSESPATLDDYARAHASFIAQLRDSVAGLSEAVLRSGGATGAAIIPSGTTAQRPGSPANGYVRYNTDNADFEAYIGGAWVPRSTFTKAVNEATIVSVASAATTNIGAAAANTINITGTTTITAFDTVASGARRILVFAGVLTLTHNATSLILPGSANITTTAGDVAEFVSLGSGNWRCTSFQSFVKPASWHSVIASGSAQATTSGTAIDFTGIPSWAKRVTVMLNGVSTNGTSQPVIRLGSGAVQSTGYIGSVSDLANGSTGTSSETTGLRLVYGHIAANTIRGAVVLENISGNSWVCRGQVSRTDAVTSSSAADTTLSGALDRIRLTTVNGTDTFDAGSVNIIYEG